jgi:hypothetical protein
MKAKLECLALFIGMQSTSEGWYDNDEELHLLPYTNDNTFEELLFHKSWDWLAPVMKKVYDVSDELMDFDLFDGTHNMDELEDAIWKGDPEFIFGLVYNLVVEVEDARLPQSFSLNEIDYGARPVLIPNLDTVVYDGNMASFFITLFQAVTKVRGGIGLTFQETHLVDEFDELIYQEKVFTTLDEDGDVRMWFLTQNK